MAQLTHTNPTATVQIVTVAGRTAFRKFIDFPHQLYAGDPNYVPELYVSQQALLDRQSHPFFKHATADFFLAIDELGKVVGRIAAIDNSVYNEFTGENVGFFGFFDVIDDQNVSSALLDCAVNWVKTRGLSRVIGPVNPSTNEPCGVLVENFEVPPYLLTTYNYPYYARLLEEYGFQAYTDLLSYELTPDQLTPRMIEVGQQMEARLAQRGITIRNLNMRDFDAEIDRFLGIYNQSWDQNLGFVPMTAAEVRQMGKDLKAIIDPDFVFFAEKDGQTIGAALTVPNLNEILIRIPRGRLLPTGIFKILLGRKSIKSVRVVALGLLPAFRRTGLDMCLYVRTYQTAARKGIKHAEASWILENNPEMNRALVNIGGKMYRKHRIYSLMTNFLMTND
jgi:GNAT superfamily N-acetyltransferase